MLAITKVRAEFIRGFAVADSYIILGRIGLDVQERPTPVIGTGIDGPRELLGDLVGAQLERAPA
jgi:hypothetical protein